MYYIIKQIKHKKIKPESRFDRYLHKFIDSMYFQFFYFLLLFIYIELSAFTDQDIFMYILYYNIEKFQYFF